MTDKSCHAHKALPVSPWVSAFAPLVPREKGPVLDLACGGGRHSQLFLGLGFDVMALDRDTGSLASAPSLDILQSDLEAADPFARGGVLFNRRFAAIVVTNYLHRPLLAGLASALMPGGVLIYETFAKGNEKFGKPSNPDFLLRPGELVSAFKDHLHILAFEEGQILSPKPAMVQRLVARRPE